MNSSSKCNIKKNPTRRALADEQRKRLVTKEHFGVRVCELDVQIRELEYRLTIKLGGMMMTAIIIVATLVTLL